jgi:uncharacterized protein (DUF488 family)
MNTIYTIGYKNITAAALKAFAEAQDALVVDTRFSPHENTQEWELDSLQAFFGNRYVHVGAFGNANYLKQLGHNRIVIADPEAGAKIVLPMLEKQPIILMCVCANYETCHRKVVAETLQPPSGAPIVHLSPDDLPQSS